MRVKSDALLSDAFRSRWLVAVLLKVDFVDRFLGALNMAHLVINLRKLIIRVKILFFVEHLVEYVSFADLVCVQFQL